MEVSDPAGDALLALALAEPDRAASIARASIHGEKDAPALSYAHHALGIVLRDRGDIDLALSHLRTARRLAERAGVGDRVADVRATLGATYAMQGRTAAALRELNAAVRGATQSGNVRPGALMRRAHVHAHLGNVPEARDDLREAVPSLRQSGDATSGSPGPEPARLPRHDAGRLR
ncbi:tetratricopeptide repeat protein [Nocardioides sp. B-3]|uniref:tetratricopeptide repeat protein n=1 Tax=Nocardioides sp. B-3 TaxID=2895565 RepID=UPI003FA60A95